MHSEVTVVLGADQEFHLIPHAQLEPHEARRWLDDQFVELDCQPVRASGKVLLVDKVLAVADAAGAQQLGDADWAGRFAAAVVAALGKSVVRIDVLTSTISS